MLINGATDELIYADTLAPLILLKSILTICFCS